MFPELLFHIGIGVCVFAAVSAVAVTIVFRLFKKRLDQQLNAEYGERRR